MNILNNLGSQFSGMNALSGLNFGNLGSSGIGLNINCNFGNISDMANFSSELMDGFASNGLSSLNLGGLTGLGSGSGLGMVPGFGGTCNPTGSGFGGQMQQTQMTQMMMMMMQMMMMMMTQMMGGTESEDAVTGTAGGGGTGSTGGVGSTGGTGSTIGTTDTSAINTSNEGDATGKSIVELAASRLGDPYSQAKAGQGDYTDCSYLAQWCYKQKGVDLPRTAAEQCKYCEENGMTVSKSELQPGDLVFWSFKENGRYKDVSHVGIYAGNGEVIDASSSKGQVVHRDIFSEGAIVSCGRPR